MSKATSWMPTDHVICGDVPITEYKSANGVWTMMRGTDAAGIVRTFERAGSAWVEQN